MIKLILISITLNFLLVFFYKRINFFSVYNDKQSKSISLIGGNIIIINFIIFFIYSVVFDKAILDEFFSQKRQLYSFIIASIGIYLMGVFDDKYNLSPMPKIFVMLFFILFAILGDNNLSIYKLKFQTFEITLGVYSLFFSSFCFLVFINAINMFDGINLQVSFYSIFILIYLFLNFFQSNLCLFLIISLLSFSILNAKNVSFLGNSGSHFLGFLFSYLLIKFYNFNINTIYVEEIVLLMLVPGLDMLRVSSKRIMSGNNPLKGDINHLHHIIKDKLNSNYALLVNFVITVFPILIHESLKLQLIYTILIGTLVYYSVFLFFRKNIIFE
jgi:UDP-N-acetylmuramyl pentapeptide phosphotransferase/UDP-N-acetylglucosamine-1-phosphate transferase